MVNFRMDNGKGGVEYARHTATGYECIANHSGNEDGHDKRIKFFARHVVGGNGHPYIEVGLNGLDDSEKPYALSEMKEALKSKNFAEVSCLSDIKISDPGSYFAEHITLSDDSVALRVTAKKNGISTIISALGQLIYEASKEFVKEQEEVEDVLFHSLLNVMGPELSKGPGGKDRAIEKVHQLAREFEEGLVS